MPLYVTEYADVTVTFGGTVVHAPSTPPLVDQTPVAIGAGSLQSAVFGENTRMVRLHTNVICSYAVGTNPTATANSRRMAANSTEFIRVEPGFRVAVIQNT